jgi:hypothetical protein
MAQVQVSRRFGVSNGYRIQSFLLRLGLVLYVLLGASLTLAPTTLTPSSLGFGNQVVQQASALKTATFKNTQSVSLTISSITITGTNASDFAYGGNCPITPQTLAAGKSCSITVIVTPKQNNNSPATGHICPPCRAMRTMTLKNAADLICHCEFCRLGNGGYWIL